MAEATIINVKAELGEHCITIAQGEQLYAKIHPRLARGENVQLDFEGVSVFASPFFNAAIGQLLKDLQPEQLNQLLRVENLAAYGLETMARVIQNSKEYFANPATRKMLDAILTDRLREQ